MHKETYSFQLFHYRSFVKLVQSERKVKCISVDKFLVNMSARIEIKTMSPHFQLSYVKI